ncbi:CaiB/BaiF CoA-transferase family protein [Sporomusa sp.]|uniref:CaiB/BaiF CoA transferase family protein n=1 Tax=Sporomusa sp. TaxID=2078658 RepID=UPI002CC91BCB|nr:CaiB/BaiF CoA-transferase family protein [Sporomusa sp.]HWR05745.1 CaiB/BaiF CoA-transferase family protein [Sporomusa sp.]
MGNIFDGLRVVDFTNNIAGPFPTAILADFGAEIIKIERPKNGDSSRSYLPILDGVGLPFIWGNRGKKSLVLDMRDPEGVEIAKKLITTADLVVESFKPGTMEKFGLGFEALQKINPTIILCSISAFGQTGPYSNKPGYDTIAQSYSGIMDMTGDADGSPTRIGFAIADYNAGIFGYAGIVSALYHRERTGVGQHVDISLLDCITAFNGQIESAGLGNKPTRSGNHHGSLGPFGVYQGNGGTVTICAPETGPWTTLCGVMGKPELATDPLFANNTARVKNLALLVGIIESWLKSFPSVDEPVSLMDKAGVPCAKILSTADMLNDEQLKARGMITDLETPDGVSVGTVIARGNPLKFSAVKAVLKKAPALGQHEAEILQSIGYDEAAIAQLKSKWSVS